MKTFYSEYVQHCMRFYVRHPQPRFCGTADKLNWFACDRAFKGFTDIEREILKKVYGDGDTLPDNVYKLSTERQLKQEVIWKLVSEIERRVARCRGLI